MSRLEDIEDRPRRPIPTTDFWADNNWNLNPATYGDTSATYWKLYGSEAGIYDENLVDTLNGNSGSSAFLATLFSSIVASFIIEIYKTLPPNNGQNAVDIPASSALRINILLFLSFFLSMMSAIGCALINKWCENYKKFAYPQAAPHTRGRVRTYLFRGFEVYHMRRFVNGIHVFLHISVLLFFWALSDFFYNVNHQFGIFTRYSLVGPLIIYFLLSIFPLVYHDFPYDTPITHPIRAAGIILRIIIRSPLWIPRWIRGQPFNLTGLPYCEGTHFDRARLYAIEAKKQAKKLEPYAMKWLFTDSGFSDSDMDKFLEGLPGYMSSNHTENGQLHEYLTAEHIQGRIKQHFITCATSVELSDQDRIARVSSCAKALMLIFEYSPKSWMSISEAENKLELQRTYIQGLMDDLQVLCQMEDLTTALRASCIHALAVQGFLSQLIPLDSGETHSSGFPTSLIPIYNFFFPDNHPITVSQLGGDQTSHTAVSRWKRLLHDGPLANVTDLAHAILKREHAPPSILSFCWKTLDILLTQLGTIHSDLAQDVFNSLHEATREYVRGKELGFRKRPLLEILDIVARGKRLLMVFSDHPKYHSRADVVFGKEYLRDGALLEAFAECLPYFVANNSPMMCKGVMEQIVNHDNLWISLQVTLWNTQRSDNPIPDKLRVFEDFCTVLDIAFSVLEDSLKVDWRAPEFGSLLNHFESFLTHCFQGAFMGRETSFSVGIIRARFFRALLAQFMDEIGDGGAVSFQSQWDVASLARLICILGFRDKEDADFWNSYVNGGHIGTNFTGKALEMIGMAARDGPLLILCQLGRLTVTAVPLWRSGVQPRDIEKVLKLQMKVVEDERLPLKNASDTVWEELGQLRELVNELCAKNTGEDRNLLERLLPIIDKVFNLRASGPMDSGQIQTIEGKDRAGHSGPNSLPSFHGAVQVTPGMGIVHRSFGTFLSTIPAVIPDTHSQYMGASQRRNYTSTEGTGPVSSATIPTPGTRGPASTSSRRSSDHDVEG